MKRKTSAKRPRAPRLPSEAQLKALRTSTSERRQTTIQRLRSAIDTLTDKKAKITHQTIYEESGLRAETIRRNADAHALFKAHSTHLAAQKKRKGRKRMSTAEETPAPRDPLLNYKKPQLVKRVHTLEQLVQELQHQLSLAVDAGMKREARIAELEARLAQLEPYRAFIEQWHAQMHREEQGPFSGFPGV